MRCVVFLCGDELGLFFMPKFYCESAVKRLSFIVAPPGAAGGFTKKES